MPRAPVVGMFRIKKYMEFYFRISFGDSEITIIGRDLRKPYEGMFQGNGSGTVAWDVANTPIEDSQRKKVFGVKFESSMPKISDYVIYFIFVDDGDLREQNILHSMCFFDEVVKRIKDSTNQWNGSLKVNRGTMRLEKYFANRISFIFKATGEC